MLSRRRLLRIPQFSTPDVKICEAIIRFKTSRHEANSQIRHLFFTLGHNVVAQWGTKDDIPVLKKNSVLVKRKRASFDALDGGQFHLDVLPEM